MDASRMRGSGPGEQDRCAPRCPVCEETVVDGEVVVYDRGTLIHVDCRRNDPVPRLADRPKSRRG